MDLTFNPTLARREGGWVGGFSSLPSTLHFKLVTQIIWILRKTSAQQHLFHSFSMEKKTDRKQKRKKIYWVFNNLLDCVSEFLDRNSMTGTWEGLFRICRIHFSNSIYFTLKLKLNLVHPFNIKAKLQTKERKKEIQSLQFVPETPTYPLHPNQTWGSSSIFLRIASGSKTSDW